MSGTFGVARIYSIFMTLWVLGYLKPIVYLGFLGSLKSAKFRKFLWS